ncbi:MAG: zf-HC2 domain-containing protein, partial [Thermoleophilia bacterium]|nr:zf-HC2 domain-containing protein [Thermoleophilia bacterium]
MTSSEHAVVNGLLAAAALDAVTDDERLLVDTHVAECSACRKQLAELAQTRDLLAA